MDVPCRASQPPSTLCGEGAGSETSPLDACTIQTSPAVPGHPAAAPAFRANAATIFFSGYVDLRFGYVVASTTSRSEKKIRVI